MYVENETICDRKIFLDGASIHNCKLERCTLVFNGYVAYSMTDCEFSDCKWAFNGPAANFLNFLRQIYAQGATEVVDKMFEAISNNESIPGVPEDQS